MRPARIFFLFNCQTPAVSLKKSLKKAQKIDQFIAKWGCE